MRNIKQILGFFVSMFARSQEVTQFCIQVCGLVKGFEKLSMLSRVAITYKRSLIPLIPLAILVLSTALLSTLVSFYIAQIICYIAFWNHSIFFPALNSSIIPNTKSIGDSSNNLSERYRLMELVQQGNYYVASTLFHLDSTKSLRWLNHLSYLSIHHSRSTLSRWRSYVR